MRRSIASIAFLALLTVPSLAEPENVITGTYNISFDLGLPKEAYTISVSEPREVESLSGDKSMAYEIMIENTTNELLMTNIDLHYYNDSEGTIANAEQMEQIIEDMERKINIRNAETATRTIDGTIGGIAQGDLTGSLKTYVVVYQPKIDPKQLLCTILSSFPWEEGTLSLLKTIHVEKTNETS